MLKKGVLLNLCTDLVWKYGFDLENVAGILTFWLSEVITWAFCLLYCYYVCTCFSRLDRIYTSGFHLESQSNLAVQLQDNSNLKIKDFTLLVSDVFGKWQGFSVLCTSCPCTATFCFLEFCLLQERSSTVLNVYGYIVQMGLSEIPGVYFLSDLSEQLLLLKSTVFVL